MVKEMEKIITSKVLLAFLHCQRKAHLLLHFDTKGIANEYIGILEQKKQDLKNEYLVNLKTQNDLVDSFDIKSIHGADYFINAVLRFENIEATCDLLKIIKGSSSFNRCVFEPIIFVGTYTISNEQKTELLFFGHVLSKIQGKCPEIGRIIGMNKRTSKTDLKKSSKQLTPILAQLSEIANDESYEPPIILNKNCSYCQFQKPCLSEAEKEDNLSLLSQISTQKTINKYEKKGIFTVKQLSYLYRQKKRRKKPAKNIAILHKPELQALAIQTKKIYLLETPKLMRHSTELFLDIEGVPDLQLYYLIGLLILKDNDTSYKNFWADNIKDEKIIWQQFLEIFYQYPDAPIYHYGNYDLKAVDKLNKRYGPINEDIKSRFVNVNSHIYGKVYFPVKSNSIKEIGGYLGASWTSHNASGLQSLIWRHFWDEKHCSESKQALKTYNKEDCKALKLLVNELSRIGDQVDIMQDVDFVNNPKSHLPISTSDLIDQFGAILEFAHLDSQNRKIRFQFLEKNSKRPKKGAQKGHIGYHKKMPSPQKSIRLRRRGKCYKHKGEILLPTEIISKRIRIDLVLTKNGIRKTITKYFGTLGYCSKCYRNYCPPGIEKMGRHVYGHAFQGWAVYQRVFLRLPYRIIVQSLVDLFNEKVTEATIVNFITNMALYYKKTESLIIKRILNSPYIHVDETKINIRGEMQWVWIFSDLNNVYLKHTETREADIVHEFLSGYDGVLISDFYPGYDSVPCTQQKCWSHLIKDINDDLLKAPFDTEFSLFAKEINDLIVPVIQAIDKYGLKKRHLNKFRKGVEKFYKTTILNSYFKSEVAIKYQKRFSKYRGSLFTFLEYDKIPWNNNTAERGLRPLAVQRKISGTFYESVINDYLLFLGIMQTCRFQNKSFLKFLMSEEKDIDVFKQSRTIKHSVQSNLTRTIN
jgi:predicted RecB family nuclease